MTSQPTTGTPSEGPASRYDQIVQKYDELQELLVSFGYELSADDGDLDVVVTGGEFLFTLDTLRWTGY